MTDAQVLEMIVLVFKDEKSGSEALKILNTAQKDGVISIVNAAVLKKDANGKASYSEVEDLRLRKKGRIIGGVAGAALALLGGPAGILISTAIGVGSGGLLSRLKDKGVPNEQLKEVTEV